VLATEIETPRVGDIIRYKYLWAEEAAGGQDHVNRPNPCVIVQVTPVGDRYDVVVVPITHEPQHTSKWMTVPDAVGRIAGLDRDANYVIFSEVNAFSYPSWNVISVRDNDLGKVIRGRITDGFLTAIFRGMERERTEGRLVTVDREALDDENVAGWRKNRGYPER
jgi:hypothetical protein